jgi:hypothetical protein
MPASRAAGVKCRDSVSPALTLQKTKTVCPGQKLTPDCGELFRAPQASVWEIPLLRVKRLCRETVPESASVMGFRCRPHERARVFCSPAGV